MRGNELSIPHPLLAWSPLSQNGRGFLVQLDLRAEVSGVLLLNDEEKSIMIQDITILDDLVVPLRKSGWNSTNEIHRVLLTGATGFVGAYLLFSLLEMTE